MKKDNRYSSLSTIFKSSIIRSHIFQFVYSINRILNDVVGESIFYKWIDIKDKSYLLVRYGFIDQFKQLIDDQEKRMGNYKWFDKTGFFKGVFIPDLDIIIKEICKRHKEKRSELFNIKMTIELVDLIFNRYGVNIKEVYYYFEKSICQYFSIDLFKYVTETYLSKYPIYQYSPDEFKDCIKDHHLHYYIVSYYRDYLNNQYINNVDSNNNNQLYIDRLVKSLNRIIDQDAYNIYQNHLFDLIESLHQSVNPSIRQACPTSLLFDLAVRNGVLEIVEFLYLNRPECCNTTNAIEVAIKYKNIEGVKYLVEKQTSDWVGDFGSIEDVPIIDYFIEKGYINLEMVQLNLNNYSRDIKWRLGIEPYQLPYPSDPIKAYKLIGRAIENRDFVKLKSIAETNDLEELKDGLFKVCCQACDDLEENMYEGPRGCEGCSWSQPIYLTLLQNDDLEMIIFFFEECDGAYRSPNAEREIQAFNSFRYTPTHRICKYIIEHVKAPIQREEVLIPLMNGDFDVFIYLLNASGFDLALIINQYISQFRDEFKEMKSQMMDFIVPFLQQLPEDVFWGWQQLLSERTSFPQKSSLILLGLSQLPNDIHTKIFLNSINQTSSIQHIITLFTLYPQHIPCIPSNFIQKIMNNYSSFSKIPVSWLRFLYFNVPQVTLAFDLGRSWGNMEIIGFLSTIYHPLSSYQIKGPPLNL